MTAGASVRDVLEQTGIDFSIVTAVFDVGDYLDAFIASIDAQTFPANRFEVIAVDDGSTDDSLQRLQAWERRRPGLVTVLTKENGGQATARNIGLDHARGKWVTFTDPDDVIGPAYLSEVAAFLDQHPDLSMVATRFLILDDETGDVQDAHPLRWRFEEGSSVRDLHADPDFFHGSAPAAFLRRAHVEAHGLRFDPRIRPNWEDGHFCSRYLLGFDAPTIGFVATARYEYRKRRDQSSTLQGSFGDPGRFTTVLELGFLDVLRAGERASADGRAPAWLQNLVIYELSWYLSSDEAKSGVASAALGEVAERFHELMAEVVRHLDPALIAGYRARRMKPVWIDVLLHAYDPAPWHQDYAVRSSLDAESLVRLSYRYTGAPPHEEVLADERPRAPVHAKVRDIVYHDRPLLRERIAWVQSDGSLRLRLEGRDVKLLPDERHRSPTVRGSASAGRSGRGRAAPISVRVVRRLARTLPVRRVFRDAWVLLDRITDAGDNAERLFDHLRDERPDINAWFVIDRDVPDWRRLRRAHGQRVLAHGSLSWKLAMANCRHLVSSHVDERIVKPPAFRFMRRGWRFTFLQHGVIKDDISRWLNPKPIDLLITSTPAEHASIAADHTPYVFTTKETKLTGMPRFDRLRQLGARVDPGARDLVLVAPTWRVGLVGSLRAGQLRRFIPAGFAESRFARCWLRLLEADELAAVCAEQGLTIGFLPHPELQPAMAELALPTHVRPLTFAGNDIQELVARSAVMVTDYSSMAFNAAYVDRPLVYFQFDADDVHRGGHLGRRGYFDYERDGFGPVATTVADAVARVVDVLRTSRSPTPLYQARIDAAFPMRDGGCCERVTAEIERLSPQ